MATRPPAPRQWFRLPSVVRSPAPAAAPVPEPPVPQPRLPIVRAPFRPMGISPPQPSEPQESTQESLPPPPYGVSSVPTSPIRRISVPPSPAPRTSSPTTIFPAATSPPKPQVSAPPSSPPTSPPKPAVTAFYVPSYPPKPKPTVTITTRVPSPTPYPQTIKPADKTQPQSPYNKPTAPPPSPLILPPAQLKSKAELEPTIPAETEQKTVLVQTTSEKPKSWLNGLGNRKDFEETHKHSSSYAQHGNHEVHKDVRKIEKGHRKKFSSDSDEVGMRVITIAGDNKGAFMEVINPSSKHSFGGNSHTLHKTESDGTGLKSFSSSSSDEGKSKKDKNYKAKAMLPPPMGAFTNSNVQGINNSIVFHSSCTHHDPGVHLSLSRMPSGNGFHVKDKTIGGHDN